MPQPETLLEGKYEILKKLREGGMGTIYRVRHRLLDEVRAIKVMRAHVVADADLKRRFIDEAKTATRLKHPNICTVHDFAVGEDGTAYLVMEFIEGVNLADLLRAQGPPHPALTLEIAHQALLALAYLHRKGVVHRDISPDNLMLTSDPDDRTLVKLIDLGIAKTTTDRPASELTASGTFLGKLKYASPEQFGTLKSGERLDGRSDLYGLGVVLYELLTGRRPCPGETPAELMRSHVFNPPLPFSETDPENKVPAELRTVVLKALEKERDHRYETAEDFDQAILGLRGRFREARDPEDTRSLLARVRDATPVADSFTPSVQDRLDMQFTETTPRPSGDWASVPGPPVPERANVVRMVARKAGAPMLDPDETFAAPTPGSATPPTAPMPPSRPPAPVPAESRRTTALWAVAVLLAAAAAVLFLTRPRAVTPPVPVPRPTAPPAPPVVAAAPVAAPVAATAPPAEPTAEPVPTPAATTSAPTPPAPDPRLRQALERARARATSARETAERARAPELAAEAYDRGRAMETDAGVLVARNQIGPAADAFDVASRFFAEALATARRAALPPPTAVPTARPAASTHVEPTVAVPAPERAAVVAPPPPPATKSAPSEPDRIRDVVALYEKAQNTLDADLYARVYPSVDRSRIETAFRSFASQKVVFEVRRIQLEPGGTTADVYGFETRVAVPRAGSEQRLSAERVMHLRRQGDAWVIAQLD